MIAHGPLTLKVRSAEPLGPGLKRLVLEAADGGPLPSAGAGGHIQLRLKGPSRGWKNAYSLTSPPDARDHYAIIVRRVSQSRGGSAFVHEEVSAGSIVEAGVPSNFFPVSNVARKHLLVSGGIGLTPFLSYLEQFRQRGSNFELHHLCRAEDMPIFARLLEPFGAGSIHLHPTRHGFDLAALLARQPLGTHLYTCGPHSLMDHVLSMAADLGWPMSKRHAESFGETAAGGAPFHVLLARSGIEIAVGPEQSLLEALEAAGIDAPCLCRGGACGECRLPLLEGVADHRDDFLSAEEHAAGKLILTCVSRAKGPRLVIDL
jgi:ferredoxin-NADP reductase